jgi:hypothetical protein
MPAARHTQAVLNSIYEDYGEATVPLAIDWGHEIASESEYTDEEVLPPPRLSEPEDILPAVLGRKGFGVDRVDSRFPLPSKSLSRKPALRHGRTASSESDDRHYRAERTSTLPLSLKPLPKTPAPAYRHERNASTDSDDSLWFASPVHHLPSPPRSIRSIASSKRVHRKPNRQYESDSTTYDLTPPQSVSKFSLWSDDSTDTWLSARSRLRIFMHETTSTTEIFVGQLYEVVSYVWETISLPHNIKSLTTIFSEYAIPRGNVIDIVASKSIPLERFLKSTELHVHINSAQKPRYTTLDTLEITLNNDLVHALTTTHSSNMPQIQALLRVAMIHQVGEYIHSHILLENGFDVTISPSIDLARQKLARGGEVAVMGLVGGSIKYRWRCGRIEVLLRGGKGGEERVYRVPGRLLGVMYRSVKIIPFALGELDI